MHLSEKGDDVIVIEEDKDKCEWLSKNSDSRVYNGNILDPQLLMEAAIDKVDALIVALGNDQLTRKVVDLAKSQFGVPKVVAVTKDSDMMDEIKSSGADKVVCSQDEVLAEVENVLETGDNRTLYRDKQKECAISRVSVRATSGAIGKAASKFQTKQARICTILRGNSVLFPVEEDISLEMGDELFVMGNGEAVEKLVDDLRRE